MGKRITRPEKRGGGEQALGEEIANSNSNSNSISISISHGLALLAALIAAPFLIVSAVSRGDVLNVAAASVFSANMVLLYGTSMRCHALPSVSNLTS